MSKRRPSSPSLLLSTGQAAYHLGMPRKTVQQMVREGIITAVPMQMRRELKRPYTAYRIPLPNLLEYAVRNGILSARLRQLAAKQGVVPLEQPLVLVASPDHRLPIFLSRQNCMPVVCGACFQLGLTLSTPEPYSLVVLDQVFGRDCVLDSMAYLARGKPAIPIGLLQSEDDQEGPRVWQDRGARWIWRKPIDPGAVADDIVIRVFRRA